MPRTSFVKDEPSNPARSTLQQRQLLKFKALPLSRSLEPELSQSA